MRQCGYGYLGESGDSNYCGRSNPRSIFTVTLELQRSRVGKLSQRPSTIQVTGLVPLDSVQSTNRIIASRRLATSLCGTTPGQGMYRILPSSVVHLCFVSEMLTEICCRLYSRETKQPCELASCSGRCKNKSDIMTELVAIFKAEQSPNRRWIVLSMPHRRIPRPTHTTLWANGHET